LRSEIARALPRALNGFAVSSCPVELFFELLFALLQVVGELLLQVILEALFELGLHSFGNWFHRPKPLHPSLAATGYAILGAVAGAISLWAFPQQFIAAVWLRNLNLVVTPVAAGAVMGVIGTWRRARHKEVIRLERFAYGFLFAFAMAVVRFLWAR
jgi:hypothetical protein